MKIKVVRVHLMESEHHLNKALKVLHNDVKIQHVTVFRGIEGFEKGGTVHTSEFLSLSLNLPLVIEFFDTPEKAEEAEKKIKEVMGEGHLYSFNAELE